MWNCHLTALKMMSVFLLFLQIYNEKRRQFSLVKNSPYEMVEKVASDIEKLLAKKRKALDVSQQFDFYLFHK
jgi:hypothetical protein